MKISEQILKERASAYVENGVLTKLRGTGINHEVYEELNAKRRSSEKLSQVEFDFLKTKQNVIIDNENSLEFYNFTGFTKKY